jgi:two-component system, NtrC family, response regulator AtoC
VSKKRLLLVDDEPNIRRILQVAFEKAGYFVTTAEDARLALIAFDENRPDCVLTDVTMPGMTGYELLREIKSKADTPVVIMTAFGTIPQAVQAIRDGAFEYVTKPFDLDHLKKIVGAAMESTPTRATKAKPSGNPGFIAESSAMKEVFETVAQVADSRATVLITGESGVGKEVVSKALHTLSSRSKQPFVAVSCAALPETLLESELFGYEKGAFTGATGAKAGRFELAHNGTLMLDEIGEIPMSVQVKLLRVLQEREFEKLGSNSATKVDVRLVTATNRDLKQAVDEGIFRLDLLYRLQVVELHIPPLRERLEDIAPLGQLFLDKYCAENSRDPLTVSEEALALLKAYHWPGNVRELENFMERAVVLSSPADQVVSAKLLPPALKKAA